MPGLLSFSGEITGPTGPDRPFASASPAMTSSRQKITPRPSSAFLTVDPEKNGKQVGFLMIPHSPHDDAWGATRIPVAVIKRSASSSR